MVIGITGGIASGKSEVCRILKKKGFVHIDADEVAHEVLEFPDIINEIISEFGTDVVVEDNYGNKHVDRKILGKIVFGNTKQMNKLENITHPRIVQQIKGIINDNSNDYIIEAIELVNSGLVNICDELWVIHAEPEQQIKRLTENRHLSYEEACSRLKAQENHDWDEKKADRVIYSTEPIESMERQVFDALDQFYRSKQ